VPSLVHVTAEATIANDGVDHGAGIHGVEIVVEPVEALDEA
jgi:hypothetical protein